MRITKFKVEGFRGFKEQLTLELQPKVNVFVGLNGAGKSSLLVLHRQWVDESE